MNFKHILYTNMSQFHIQFSQTHNLCVQKFLQFIWDFVTAFTRNDFHSGGKMQHRDVWS